MNSCFTCVCFVAIFGFNKMGMWKHELRCFPIWTSFYLWAAKSLFLFVLPNYIIKSQKNYSVTFTYMKSLICFVGSIMGSQSNNFPANRAPIGKTIPRRFMLTWIKSTNLMLHSFFCWPIVRKYREMFLMVNRHEIFPDVRSLAVFSYWFAVRKILWQFCLFHSLTVSNR